jgi:hypothetical protein
MLAQLCVKKGIDTLCTPWNIPPPFFIVYNFTTGEIFPAFVKPGGLLRYSQKSAIVFYPGPG